MSYIFVAYSFVNNQTLEMFCVLGSQVVEIFLLLPGLFIMICSKGIREEMLIFGSRPSVNTRSSVVNVTRKPSQVNNLAV
jgi:hypothetical protein